MPDSGGGQGAVRKYGASFSAYAFGTGMYYTAVAASSRLIYQVEGRRDSFHSALGHGKIYSGETVGTAAGSGNH